MSTLFLTDNRHVAHGLAGHPERPRRVQRIIEALDETGLAADLQSPSVIPATLETLISVHDAAYVNQITTFDPLDQTYTIGGDTYLKAGSLLAAKLAAGAGVQAVDAVLTGANRNAFCAVRPPGHHAETGAAMGFCFFNNIAIAAEHALRSEKVSRVAILDIDVHHCNGTVDIFKDRAEVLVCSSFQSNFYPMRYLDYENEHVINTPLQAGMDGTTFRRAVEAVWWPALVSFAPDIILLSAGFDAHQEDTISGLEFVDEDYAWFIRELIGIAATLVDGRLISMLEGGYSEDVLARCVADHVAALTAA